MIRPESESAFASPEEPSIRGLWQMIRAEFAGEPAHPLVVEHTTLELTHDRYFVRYASEIADRGHIVITLGEPHSSLALHGVEGPNAGRSIRAIFQFKGDLIRICYGLDGTAPTAFHSPAGSAHYLATYRRKK
jgi:uncharacterized protein (TIGR03067 family)